MIEVKVNGETEEDFLKALAKFKKLCNKDGFMKELRDKRYFKKPSEIKREKRREVRRQIQIENKKNQ